MLKDTAQLLVSGSPIGASQSLAFQSTHLSFNASKSYLVLGLVII